MFETLEKYKGVHPGADIGRELKKRNVSQRSFAISLPEHPQSFNAMIKGKRKLKTGLALKIEHALGWEEGSLLMLQVFYDIKVEKRKRTSGYHPDLSILRKALGILIFIPSTGENIIKPSSGEYSSEEILLKKKRLSASTVVKK